MARRQIHILLGLSLFAAIVGVTTAAPLRDGADCTTKQGACVVGYCCLLPSTVGPPDYVVIDANQQSLVCVPNGNILPKCSISNDPADDFACWGDRYASGGPDGVTCVTHTPLGEPLPIEGASSCPIGQCKP